MLDIQLCWTFLYLSHKEGRWDVWPDWLLLARFILWTLNIFWEIWIFENSQISVRMIADIDSNETKISVNEMNKTSSKFNIDQFFRSRRPISTPPLHFQSFCVFKQEKCDDSFRSKKKRWNMTRFCVLFSKKNLSSPHKNLKVETTLQKEFKVHCLSIISRSTSLRLDVAFTHSLTPYSRNIRSTNIMIFNGKKFLTSTRSRLTLFPITFTSFTVLFAFWLSSKEFSSVHIAFHWWWCCCYCWCLLLCFVDFFFIVFNGISIDEVYVYSEAEYMAPLERRNIFFRFLFQFSVVHFSRFSQQSSHYLISTISFDSFLAYFLILCYFSGDAATAHQIDDFTMSRTIPIGNV